MNPKEIPAPDRTKGQMATAALAPGVLPLMIASGAADHFNTSLMIAAGGVKKTRR